MSTDRIISISNSPGLRARLLQNVIARLTSVRKINLVNYRAHRSRLEKLSRLIPKLKGVQYRPEVFDGFDGEWMAPENADSDKLLYYLHGGGYAICSVNTHRRLIASIAQVSRVRAFAINYRLSPDHPFPAAVDDAVKGYQLLLEQGFRPEKIFIAGDSAGGGLTIATLLKLKELNRPLPAAAVCISPWTDLEGTGESILANARTEKLLDHESILLWGKAYSGNESLRHPLISPIHADLSALPPLYIQVSSSEILLDDSIRLHEKALSSGVNSTIEIWNGLIHVWQVHTFLPEARQAIRNIATFARNHLQ